MQQLALKLSVLGCFASLMGCEANRSYWNSNGAGVRADYKGRGYSLPDNMRVIEFDEQGDFWEREQLSSAKKLIRKSPKPPLVITFVHGWQNNARPDNGDLSAFGEFIRRLKNQPGLASYQVFGVFVAWRGAAIDSKYDWTRVSWAARQLSFWNRKGGTDRMAGIPISQTLWSLGDTAKQKGGRSVIIGHSFGARIVEKSLAGTLASTGSLEKNRLPADLVILVNPASESLYARQLKLALREWPNDRPAIISLKASDDTATGWIWGLGTKVSNFGNSRYRDYTLGGGLNPENQGTFITKTVGDDERMVNYDLSDQGIVLGVEDPIRKNLAAPPFEVYTRTKGNNPEEKAVNRWLLEKRLYAKNAHYILDQDFKKKAYWVIQLDKKILSGHSGEVITKEEAAQGTKRKIPGPRIFTEAVQDLLAGLFNTTQKLEEEE